MSISLRDPKIQKIVLLSFVGLGAVFVYFLTDMAPFTYRAQAAELDELSVKYQELSRDLTKARQMVHTLSYLEKEFDLLHEKWNRAQRLLPDEQEMASLLRAMTLLGDRSGVEFVLFRPLPPQPAQYHTEHSIEVTVDGGYHEIGTFLSELANMERIVIVSGLTLEAPRKEETKKPARASFTATTYTLGGTGVSPEVADASQQKNVRRGGGIARQANSVKKTVSRKLKGIRRGGSGE